MLIQSLESFLIKRPIIYQILRFGAIGVINTALDFAVLNFIAKTFDITSGLSLGIVNTIGFSFAVIQSYYWNKYWAFAKDSGVGFLKNFIRLCLVGALGVLILGMVIGGSKFEVSSIYYLTAFALLIIGELGIWFSQGIGNIQVANKSTIQFASFIGVSLIGLVINDVLVSVISSSIIKNNLLAGDLELVKNAAKGVATIGSLAWNFVGYKLFVFKK